MSPKHSRFYEWKKTWLTWRSPLKPCLTMFVISISNRSQVNTAVGVSLKNHANMHTNRLPINAKIFMNFMATIEPKRLELMLDRHVRHVPMSIIKIKWGLSRQRIWQIEDEILSEIENTFAYANLTPYERVKFMNKRKKI